MAIGEYIKFYRKKLKLTQKKLSEITGIAEITIRQYEAGKYEPKNENLYKLANALGVKPIDLLGWDKPGDNYVPMEERIKFADKADISPFDATGINLDDVKDNPNYAQEKTAEIARRLEQEIREKFNKSSSNNVHISSTKDNTFDIHKMNFSNNLNYLLGHYGVNLNTLSNELEIGIDTLSEWINGHKLPTKKEQSILEKYFHLEENTLIKDVILGIFNEKPDNTDLDIILKNSFLRLGLKEDEIESLKEYYYFLKSRRPDQHKDMGIKISKINNNETK